MGTSLIQSRFGDRGNFEVVVPSSHGGGLVALWRDNDADAMPWSGPSCFGGPAAYSGASLIQSNFGDPGNFEVVAVDTQGNLDFFWRDSVGPFPWSGPFRVAGDVRGTPALIQSRFGERGNFEVVVPHRDGGLVALWRDNDAGAMPWSAPVRFGRAQYVGASLIQSNFGDPGNFEVVAVDTQGNLDFFWRDSVGPFPWSGPFRVGAEISFAVSECVYAWTARYHQGDTHVTVRVQLQPDAGITAATMATLRTRWRDGIIATWSDRFDCLGGQGSRKRITFDVHWVDAGAHHVVRVRPGPAASDLGTWDTSDTGDVAAHEFGHMLGHPDEYTSAVCPMRPVTGTGTVMDDNTEAVQRHYDRIASQHCGHRPEAAVTGFAGTIEDADIRIQMLDRLRPRLRSEVLSRLRALADLETAPEGVAERAHEAVISLEISGGAPGDRIDYRVAVRGDGTAERRLVDQLRGADPQHTTRELDRAVAAQVFAAAEEAGLLADEAPRLALVEEAAGLMPDALVAVVSVGEGDVVRRVVVPVSDPGDPRARSGDDAVGIPLSPDVLLPRTAVEALGPVLRTLREAEARLDQ